MNPAGTFTGRMTARLLAAHGVATVVASPGSRNAVLINEMCACRDLGVVSVVDERQAAFIALGIAEISQRPVALVCTSGTALLNYAPAVAEAYYRRLPLIVVSADRPSAWIDQDDSQTLRQNGALAAIVKATRDIPADAAATPEGRWVANRLVNDALLTAVAAPAGPVHLNIAIGEAPEEPVGGEAMACRVIRRVSTQERLMGPEADAFAAKLHRSRVLVVAGFAAPSDRLNRAMARLAALPGVAVVAENIANIHAPGVHFAIDRLLDAMSPEERTAMLPDVLLTIGGALVSRKLKEWLRGAPASMEHWHIGHTPATIDCMQHLSLRVDIDPGEFLLRIAGAMRQRETSVAYNACWDALAAKADTPSPVEWGDLAAFSHIMPRIPARWNLQLGNGTAIRLSNLFDCSRIHRVDCNRGVSGIDGATSTAIGAALAYADAPTLLITGDMGAFYDFSALLSHLIPDNFKMIVMDNGGGDIFRKIRATRNLDIVEERLACRGIVAAPYREIAQSRGFDYFEATDAATLASAWPRFAAAPRPALLLIGFPINRD